MKPVTQVWLKVLEPFWYHTEEAHKIGETIPSSITEANKLIKDGKAELCVNNNGANMPIDEPTYHNPLELNPAILEEIAPAPQVAVFGSYPVAEAVPHETVFPCWFCNSTEGDLLFDMEFDTPVHADCIRKTLADDPEHPEAKHMKYLLELNSNNN